MDYAEGEMARRGRHEPPMKPRVAMASPARRTVCRLSALNQNLRSRRDRATVNSNSINVIVILMQ